MASVLDDFQGQGLVLEDTYLIDAETKLEKLPSFEVRPTALA